MDTMKAFFRAQSSTSEQMVFDWDKAARLIKESKPQVASAGLSGDWFWTAGKIFKDGELVMDGYTFLSSNHATPILDLDGNSVECWVYQSQKPEWGSSTKWPDTAVEILNSGD